MNNKRNEVESNAQKMSYCINKWLCVLVNLSPIFNIIERKIDSSSVSALCLRKQNQSLHAHKYQVAKVLQHLIHAGCGGGGGSGGVIETLIEQCSMHTLPFAYTKCLCMLLRHVSHKHTLPGQRMLFNIHSHFCFSYVQALYTQCLTKYPNKNKRIPVRFVVDLRAAGEREVE